MRKVLKSRLSMRQFVRDEDGATAIEYALIASIVGLGILTGLQLIPPALNALFALVVSNF